MGCITKFGIVEILTNALIHIPSLYISISRIAKIFSRVKGVAKWKSLRSAGLDVPSVCKINVFALLTYTNTVNAYVLYRKK